MSIEELKHQIPPALVPDAYPLLLVSAAHLAHPHNFYNSNTTTL
ncbi:MAG TPA: hypothetical protein VNA19_13210 [Pyrinomonadaceae bacterium]|nr:hypothetical protein [Pyrinomonadaceae bacterium]